ncbi:isochorismate synthase [Saccharomonospora glauca]|uniref:isochorismate synthase n=1 Tax=Saccharomonospora glauca K62 TaxID=928724 RepID=I1D2U6_9PSEU|nr:isochorismate synthase [Saccharomonospora glauca]EIE99270.1 isochorismate synthase family protein [Saccharomonospora glauca K62]
MSSSVLTRPRPEYRSADLLTAYLPGSFYYSSPRGTVLADGVSRAVRADTGRRAEAVSAALASAREDGVPDPIAVGALGFLPTSESSLVIPAVVRRAEAPEDGHGVMSPRQRDGFGPWTVTPRPGGEVYRDAVARALRRIERGDLEKVVLARSLELTADTPVPVPELLARVVRANPAAHAFAVDVTAVGDPAPRTLVGASPELLVSRRGATVVANPLAGSRPRSTDEAENRRRIADLLASSKDRREHAHVAARVAEVLGRFCDELHVPEPEVIGTPTMWHLSTRITGTLADPRDPASSSLALAEALHPTPAVCGTPTAAARDLIAELEPEDRGYYAGLVGWTAPDGDGEWVVTIRCAEVCDRTVRVFAGAGIVEGSDPAAELAETSAKFRTLLGALGAEEVA